MYFIYLIQCSDKSIYTGITTDVTRRFNEHKNGIGGHYTRAKQVVKVLYTEQFKTRSEALKREAEIKSWRREKKLNLVNNNLKKTKNIYLIGIVGPSGSGKTTLGKRLKSLYKDYEHIRLDNYFKSPKTFPKKGEFLNWELPKNLKFDVLLSHLKTLKNGGEVHTKTFPKKAGGKRESITLKPKRIIIIEGFMLFKDKKIRDILDIKIYLDIHPELMLKHRAMRFGEAHIKEYDTKVAIPEFLKYGVTQKKYADYVIDATQSQSKVIKEVQKIIKLKT